MSDYKINAQKSTIFPCIIYDPLEKIVEKNILLTIAKKDKIARIFLMLRTCKKIF